MTRRSKYKNIFLFAVLAGLLILFLAGRNYCLKGHSPQEVDFWIRQLSDGNNAIRMGAVKKLGAFREKKAVPYLSDLLAQDNNLWVRVECAIALGNIGDVLGVDPLLAALESNNPPVRREAATALGKIGDPGSVENLMIRLRKDNNRLVRIRIIEALGLFGDKRVKDTISAYLTDSDIWVRRVSYQALNRLGKELN